VAKNGRHAWINLLCPRTILDRDIRMHTILKPGNHHLGMEPHGRIQAAEVHVPDPGGTLVGPRNKANRTRTMHGRRTPITFPRAMARATSILPMRKGQ